MNMRTRPVAVSVAVSAILVIAINALVDLLSDVNWKTAVVRALMSLVPIVGGGKVAHDNVYAPETVDAMKVRYAKAVIAARTRPAHVPDAGQPPTV